VNVIAMDRRVAKNISGNKPEGRRKVRSPRFRFIEDVENEDYYLMGYNAV
jgi:hypothetical protein